MKRHRLPLNALRAFEAASRHRSVGRAAEELCVTSGAISQQIQQLEEWMGVPLRVRDGRRMRLTLEGRQLGRRLEPAFDQLQRAVNELRAGVAPCHLRLRLAPTLAIRWLIPALAEFTARHPDIEVEIDTTAIARARALDGVDFAVCIRTAPPAADDEDWVRLFDDAFIPVCSPMTARALRKPADLAQVPRLHSIIRPESWGIWLTHAGLGLDPLAGPRFANAALAYQAAADDLGVAIGQMAYVGADLRSGRLVAPFDAVASSPWTYYLVNARHKSGWPKIEVFRKWCAELASRAACRA